MTPAIVKVGLLGSVAVAVGGTGIWYLTAGSRLISLSETEEAKTENSLGKKYGAYFLSHKHNKWKWRELQSNHMESFKSSQDKFQNVKEDGSEGAKSLDKVCEEVYKETTSSNLLNIDTTTDNNKYLVKNIWKYCALGEIKTVEENKDAGYDSKIGGDTNKKILVSTKAPENYWFWEIRNKEFWSETGDRSKGQAQGEDSEANNVFKQAAKESQTNPKKHIKEICEEAYGKNTETNDPKKNKANAELFCSIKLDLSTTPAIT